MIQWPTPYSEWHCLIQCQYQGNCYHQEGTCGRVQHKGYCQFCKPWHPSHDFNVFFSRLPKPTSGNLSCIIAMNASTSCNWTIRSCCLHYMPSVWYHTCLVVCLIHWPLLQRRSAFAIDPSTHLNSMQSPSLFWKEAQFQYLRATQGNPMSPLIPHTKVRPIGEELVEPCQKQFPVA